MNLKKLQKVPVEHYDHKVPDKPLVSVCVQTYQHAKYIKECLDSILMQETNFNFEILLGEDESTDGTREICIEYAQKYPEKIRLFLHKRENVIYISGQPTGRFNVLYNLKETQGKYIALCEGDDYWTDPLKLQKQVDFLKSNNDYKLCFHRSYLLKGDEKEIFKIPENKSSFKIVDLINNNNFIATCSVVFKKPDNFQIPEWFFNLPFADIALYYLIVQEDKMYCLPEFMSFYRIHENGLWSGSSELNNLRRYVKFFNQLMPALSPGLKKAAIRKRKLFVKRMAKHKYPKKKILRKLYVLKESLQEKF